MRSTDTGALGSAFSVLDARLAAGLERGFLWKTLVVALFLAYFFQFPTYRDLPTAPPALALLEMKDQIFDQIDYPPGSHLAKKTLRVIIPSLVNVFGIHSVMGIHLLMVGCNVLLLVGVASFLQRETGDCVFSFLATCGFACIFPGTAGFTDVKGWADVIPYLFLLGTVWFRQPWIIFFSLLFAGLGDERALVGSLFVILWWIWKSEGNAHPFSQLLRNPRIHAVLAAWVSFFAVRVVLASVFGFETRLGVVGLTAFLSLPIEYFFLGSWSAFEAYWLLFPAVLMVLWVRGHRFYAMLLAGAVLANIAGSFLIHDITKSLGYSYVGALACLVFLHAEVSERGTLRLILGVLTVVCILAPTQYIYGSHWLYAPLPMWGFQWLKEWALALRG